MIRDSVAKLEHAVRAQIVTVGLIGDPRRRGYNVRPAEIGYNEDFDKGTLRGGGKLGAGKSFQGLLSSTKVSSFCV